MREKWFPTIPRNKRIGAAWPPMAYPDQKLEQGRSMLESSRFGDPNFPHKVSIIDAFLTIHSKTATPGQKAQAHFDWRNGVREHQIASSGPIASAKIEKGIFITQLQVERRVKRRIHDEARRRGGTEKQAKMLAQKLVAMTKNFQRLEGVPDEKPKSITVFPIRESNGGKFGENDYPWSFGFFPTLDVEVPAGKA